MVTPDAGTVTANALTPGTTYQLRLRATNSVGTCDPATVTATTLPTPVAKPTAIAGTTSATVTWTQSPTTTGTGYTVRATPARRPAPPTRS